MKKYIEMVGIPVGYIISELEKNKKEIKKVRVVRRDWLVVEFTDKTGGAALEIVHFHRGKSEHVIDFHLREEGQLLTASLAWDDPTEGFRRKGLLPFWKRVILEVGGFFQIISYGNGTLGSKYYRQEINNYFRGKRLIEEAASRIASFSFSLFFIFKFTILS